MGIVWVVIQHDVSHRVYRLPRGYLGSSLRARPPPLWRLLCAMASSGSPATRLSSMGGADTEHSRRPRPVWSSFFKGQEGGEGQAGQQGRLPVGRRVCCVGLCGAAGGPRRGGAADVDCRDCARGEEGEKYVPALPLATPPSVFSPLVLETLGRVGSVTEAFLRASLADTYERAVRATLHRDVSAAIWRANARRVALGNNNCFSVGGRACGSVTGRRDVGASVPRIGESGACPVQSAVEVAGWGHPAQRRRSVGQGNDVCMYGNNLYKTEPAFKPPKPHTLERKCGHALARRRTT